LLALLLTDVTSAFAQLPAEARAGLWKAQWITSASAPERDMVVLHFQESDRDSTGSGTFCRPRQRRQLISFSA